MLEKIQTISTNLDKKRVYTALAALIVALATGHVMQRTVSRVDLSADAPAPQEVPQPAAANLSQIAPASAAPQGVAEIAPQQPAAVTEDAPIEVTRADTQPSTEPLAGLQSPVEPEDAAPKTEKIAAAPVVEPQVGEEDGTAIDIAAMRDNAPADADVTPEPAPQVAEVTRAALEEDLPMPALDGPEFDIDPPAGTLTARTPVTDDCAMTLDTTPAPGALIDVSFSAPCAAGAEVQFDHVGLRFTETLNDAGTLDITVPAMAGAAEITATIAGRTLSDTVTVPDIAQFDRVALMWQGGTGLQLHALEDGAYYGDPGHIWAETPGMPTRATSGEGGFLTVLGSTSGGYAADVYTYPVALETAPQISIEAQVLDSTCSKPILGEYMRAVTDGAPSVTQVGMIVPDCDAVGEYLVLKNLPADLTIARN
jgi:hypothetical protein